MQAVQQLACGWQTENRFGEKGGGEGQGPAVLRGTPFPAARGSNSTAEREHVQLEDQQTGLGRLGCRLDVPESRIAGFGSGGKIVPGAGVRSSA